MNLLHLALNLLRRDWRAGEWRVLLLALVVAVGALATVGLFADRVRVALQQQAHGLLGADLRITSTRPLSPDYRRMAAEHGLQVVQSRSFPSMVTHGEQVLLAEVQAVETGYPLRGRIEIDDGRRQVAQAIPAPGTLWVDERLQRRLALNMGDEVSLGARRFRVVARIVKDVDQSLGFASFAPRVLMNESDLAATGLVQPGSRLTYRLLFAGAPERIAALQAALQPRLTAHEKLEDVRDARPEIRVALERAEHFLGLAALTAAILAGVALALAARRFVTRHLDGVAMMRCLGAQQRQVLALFLWQFVLLGIGAVLLGGMLGYVVQSVLVSSVPELAAAGLPPPGIRPLLQAAISGFALLLGFAFLPLMQLRRVSPLRVLRRELGLPPMSGWLIYGLALAVLALLFLWHAGSLRLGLTVLAALLVGLLLFGALAWGLLRVLARQGGRCGAQWRQAFGNLARQGSGSALQVVALSLGGMALLALTLVRDDLLQGWQQRLPPDAPNRFLVNVQPDQLDAVRAFFRRAGLPAPEFQPMVRGRLIAINGRAVSGDSYAEGRARALVEREFNLSYMDSMPGWNETVAGSWWPPGAGGQLSVEQGIAQTLGIRLGDTLTYDVAGSVFSARVSHLRRVQWDSMRVNFFVIATPELLRDQPASYLASVYLPPDKVRAGDELARAFPNLVLIDTGVIIAQVRAILDRITQAVSAVFLFTLLAGLAVLYAALLATQDERNFAAAILRTLGADSRYLWRLHLAEFTVLGGLSGAFAAAGASLLGWVLARFVLEVPYLANPWLWLFGIGGGVLIVAVSGLLATGAAIRHPPLAVLRGG
ncbi:MAG: FtsX-like permease family protein [Sideroxydans sp.]